jgi:hypothetical protein
MKNKNLVLKSAVFCTALLFAGNVKAQNDVGEVLRAAPEDATKLVNAYMSPLFKGLGVGLNSGWNTTAKTKGLLRFDLRITASAAFVPTSDQSYDTKTLGLKSISPLPGQNGIGPTAFGDDNEGSRMQVNNTTSQFNLPQGLGFHVVPSPQIQLTVGLPKNIDVSLRYVPQIKLGDDIGKIGMYGVGVKTEVFPLLLGQKANLIPFDVAVALAFSRLNYDLPLEVGDVPHNNQKIEMHLNGFNAEAIISKKLLFFTPFASVGYNSSSSNLKALGTYEFKTSDVTANYVANDPVNIKQTDVSGMKASLGFQLNLAFFRVYASYTAAKYSYANAGIGFGFGK